jgi:hypothetical protein
VEIGGAGVKSGLDSTEKLDQISGFPNPSDIRGVRDWIDARIEDGEKRKKKEKKTI